MRLLFAGLSFFFERVDHPPPVVFVVPLDYIFFLLGIIVVWYLIGRGLDNRRGVRDSHRIRAITKLLLVLCNTNK